MATSSKTSWRLEALKENALRSIEEQITAKREELDSYTDPEKYNERVRDWRAAQETKIAQVFHRLGDFDIGDYELSQFKLDPMPKEDPYQAGRARVELRDLENKRSQIIAKADSLVADEDGTISLTKTQLAEFFGL